MNPVGWEDFRAYRSCPLQFKWDRDGVVATSDPTLSKQTGIRRSTFSASLRRTVPYMRIVPGGIRFDAEGWSRDFRWILVESVAESMALFPGSGESQDSVVDVCGEALRWGLRQVAEYASGDRYVSVEFEPVVIGSFAGVSLEDKPSLVLRSRTGRESYVEFRVVRKPKSLRTESERIHWHAVVGHGSRPELEDSHLQVFPMARRADVIPYAVAGKVESAFSKGMARIREVLSRLGSDDAFEATPTAGGCDLCGYRVTCPSRHRSELYRLVDMAPGLVEGDWFAG
jgi:hypothetical protein